MCRARVKNPPRCFLLLFFFQIAHNITKKHWRGGCRDTQEFSVRDRTTSAMTRDISGSGRPLDLEMELCLLAGYRIRLSANVGIIMQDVFVEKQSLQLWPARSHGMWYTNSAHAPETTVLPLLKYCEVSTSV